MQNSSTEILFDKFEILSCLKKDSCSSVYIANHIYLGKKIILKTLDTRELKDKVILERFKREAKILALLNHPNLIRVLDFGTYGDFFYLSFEYFESINLREVIARQKLSGEQKHHLLVQLLRALNIAHQNNIVHRDIKPENILVNSSNELRIADFGLAVILNENALTNKASIVGTPGYMSPEQIRGENLNLKSDMFSAGIVALELFTGINPFIGSNINETINHILTFKEEKINELTKNLTPAIQNAIKLMLKKNPAERGKDVNDILNLLGVSGEIFTPVEVKIKKDHRKKTYIVSSSLLTLLSAILIVYFFISSADSAGPDNLKERSQLTSGLPDKKDTSAPDSQVNMQPVTKMVQESGKLQIDASPWAEVYVNNKKISRSPLRDYPLTPGVYYIRLTHPDYPVFKRKIEMAAGETETININFKEITGSLDCKLYPWGEIFIDDEYKSQTPIREPIILMPGKYKLTVKNPQFGVYTETIRIRSKEIFEFKYNFENNQKL